MILKILLLIVSFGCGACLGILIMALMLNASKCSRWEEEMERKNEEKRI